MYTEHLSSGIYEPVPAYERLSKELKVSDVSQPQCDELKNERVGETKLANEIVNA